MSTNQLGALVVISGQKSWSGVCSGELIGEMTVVRVLQRTGIVVVVKQYTFVEMGVCCSFSLSRNRHFIMQIDKK